MCTAEVEALLAADVAAARAQREAAATAEAARREAASAERMERERLAQQRSEEKRLERAQREKEKADRRYAPNILGDGCMGHRSTSWKVGQASARSSVHSAEGEHYFDYCD